jgi:ABC-type Na+ efflux pump permease subunit
VRFVLSTATKDLRRRLRDPLGMVLWLVIPMMIAGMLSLAFGGRGGRPPQARVLVVDEDRGLLSRLLVSALGQQQQGQSPFAAEEVTLPEGRRRIDAGDGTALLVIPKDFSRAVLLEQPCTLTLVTNPAQTILPAMTRTGLEILVDATFYAHRISGEPLRELATAYESGGSLSDAAMARISVGLNRMARDLAPLLSPPLIDVAVAVKSAEKRRGFGEIFFPSTLFMTLFFMASGLAEDIWREKNQGTLRRALASPHGPAALLLGKLLGALLLFAAVSVLGLAAGRWAFGLEIAHLPLAAAWMSLSGVLLTSLLLFLQLHASSESTAHMLSNVVTFPLLMLGGSFFPFEAMPEWMARIGRWTPNGWALETLKAILWGLWEPRLLLASVAGLVAVIGLLFLLSVRRLAGAFIRG